MRRQHDGRNGGTANLESKRLLPQEPDFFLACNRAPWNEKSGMAQMEKKRDAEEEARLTGMDGETVPVRDAPDTAAETAQACAGGRCLCSEGAPQSVPTADS